MKINIKKALSAAAASLMFTACIGDLDTLPLNPSEVTSEVAYGNSELAYLQGLTKIYFQFASNDTKDLIVDDGGSSELIRAFWSTQEISSDACKVGWGNDSWAQDLNNNTWSPAHNHMIYSVYIRTLQGVAYVNEYLRQTAPDRLESRGVGPELAAKIESFRAEARFLRAYFYWMAFDSFGNVPFAVESTPIGGGNNPPQTARAEVFNFIVGELEALAADGSPMPEAQSNYPRADKGSCLGLLARLYLNAKVYTGTEMYDKAKLTCERIYALGKYSICPDYAALFRGDNGENAQAKNEMLFAVAYDSESTKSYGGTTFLNLASVASEDGDNKWWTLVGVKGGDIAWAGIRTTWEYVTKYFDVKNPRYDYNPGLACTTADLVTRDPGYDVVDNRGKMFHIFGRQQNISDAEELYIFLHGWSCLKFNNHPHDKDAAAFEAESKVNTNSDIDYPLIRLGEIHLIYAEACMHAGGDASAKLAELASRAGVAATTQAGVNQDWLVAERARELMWEGHRRTDLIRYGLYTSGDFKWPFKGGKLEGQALGDHMNVFAIPKTEREGNPDLVQNPGYVE